MARPTPSSSEPDAKKPKVEGKGDGDVVAIKRILAVTLTAKTEKARRAETLAASKNGVNMSALREVKVRAVGLERSDSSISPLL